MKQIQELFILITCGLLALTMTGKAHSIGRGMGLPCQGSGCPKPLGEQDENDSFRPQSCLDYLRKGEKNCGVYKIYDTSSQTFPVYCDMNSEPGSAWTLVMSWSTANRALSQFRSYGFAYNQPVNNNVPNWKMYRQTKAQMDSLKTSSTHWRATCSFPTHGVDYTDYVRGNFKDLDIMTYSSGGSCRKVELINIRGILGIQTTARFSQSGSSYGLHVDSHAAGCSFNAKSGAISGEDNFGYYANINPKFRCTAGPQATTQWWFGGHL